MNYYNIRRKPYSLFKKDFPNLSRCTFLYKNPLFSLVRQKNDMYSSLAFYYRQYHTQKDCHVTRAMAFCGLILCGEAFPNKNSAFQLWSKNIIKDLMFVS